VIDLRVTAISRGIAVDSGTGVMYRHGEFAAAAIGEVTRAHTL